MVKSGKEGFLAPGFGYLLIVLFFSDVFNGDVVVYILIEKCTTTPIEKCTT